MPTSRVGVKTAHRTTLPLTQKSVLTDASYPCLHSITILHQILASPFEGRVLEAGLCSATLCCHSFRYPAPQLAWPSENTRFCTTNSFPRIWKYFYTGPDSKYFHLCRPHVLCLNYTTLPLENKSSHSNSSITGVAMFLCEFCNKNTQKTASSPQCQVCGPLVNLVFGGSHTGLHTGIIQRHWDT